MSKPENKLNQYDTYSYYQTLVACSNTEVAAKLATSNGSSSDEITKYSRPAGLANRYDVIDNKQSKIGDYIILIDGARDANFVITAAKWTNVIMPMPDRDRGVERYTSMAVEGSLTVMEPLGAGRFYQAIIKAMDNLGTDPSGAIFLLKTFFVGHKIDSATGRSTTEYISNIQPMMLLVWSIEADFDNVSSMYQISFIALSNGAAKAPQVGYVLDAVNSFSPGTGEAPSLIKTFEVLTSVIEGKYKEHRNNLNKNAQENSKDANAVIKGRNVRYKFELDPVYGNEYVLDATKSQTHTLSNVVINFNSNGTVEEAIDIIMRACKKVLEDGDGVKEGNETIRYIYKIISTVISSNTDITYVYKINRYRAPTSQLNQLIESGGKLPANSPGVITFDYYYTGKNVDVLEFDMKMAMGLAFLQTLVVSDSLNSETSKTNQALSTQTSTTSTTGGGQNTTQDGKIREGRPIFFPKRERSPLVRNTSAPSEASTFQSLLSRFSAVENLEVKLKIVGNVALLNDLSPIPHELVDGLKPNNDSIAGRWDTTPFLAKINIKMPVYSDSVSSNVEIPSSLPTTFEDFWYKGYYMIIGVDNEFADGEFTQVLDMISIPAEPFYSAGDK